MKPKRTKENEKEKRERRDDPGHSPPVPAAPMLTGEPTMPPDPSERAPRRPFLSRGEVSRLFGVSVSTVTRWARLGLLQVVRTPGGHYRFPADETRRAAERAWNGELTRLD
jgi:excisionase family DNA binding protein